MVAQAPCGSVQLHTRLLVFQEDPKALARKAPEGGGGVYPCAFAKPRPWAPGCASLCFAFSSSLREPTG